VTRPKKNVLNNGDTCVSCYAHTTAIENPASQKVSLLSFPKGNYDSEV
jgi:hypothetical protein